MRLRSGPVPILGWLQKTVLCSQAAGGLSPNQLQRRWPIGREGNDCESNRLVFVRYDEVNQKKKQAHTEYQCVERRLSDKEGNLL